MSQEHSPTGDSDSSTSVLSTTGLSPPRNSITQGKHYEHEHDCRASICSQHSSCSMKFEKTTYESAPVARNTPENNQVRIIDYRGTKLTSFHVDGRELICLPQAFDLFLKNLVGGLHTVYTKLKRLEIIPVVCNVEQVRILRGLGAIQPGVNRCKLLAPAEFDILYDDCTNSGSRPGRPPKRNSAHQIDDCLDDKRIKLSSSFLLRSFPDFTNQTFKYPVHSNGYVSIPTTNGNQSSSFTHSFGYSAFAPTLPIHFSHSHPSPYHLVDSRTTRLNETNYKSSSIATSSSSATSSASSSSYRPLSSNELRPFTIDAMLSNSNNNHNNGKNLNKENSQQRDRLIKPIDLSITATDTSSPTNEQTSSLSSSSSTTLPTAAALNFFHIKNMIELTVESARLREKQLENEIVDLRNELTKEQDCRQKLEQDILELRRVRNVLVKKLKRLNRSSATTRNCSNSNRDKKNESSSPPTKSIPIESI
ncbi:unnamed protein product [Rotaria sp. Silwood2]|nr:unnamed protein product [Rotaria sp. Silwood2]CAF2467666.1 unnamed protein product [Rotaria sp. Silwood2]CAF2703655.1 unnamed protein product [Rotaria sp. Silwood2]CAF2856243.1 unnamed protein product [Rotaria sp. Silwood2]CAF4042493.1 unnamed protein product [Rotaria sp. Silwood2]